MNRPLLVAIAIVLPCAVRAGATGPCVEARSPRLDRAAAPIRSQAELDAWLAGRPAAGDPLGALSPPARASFLASLRFGPQGLASFQSDGIQSELSAVQAWRLLALFGLQSALAAIPELGVRSPEDAEVDAWWRSVSPRQSP